MATIYPEKANHFLNKYATDQTLEEYGTSNDRYLRLVNTALHRCSDDLVAKSCKVAEVYDIRSLKHVFIESVAATIYYYLRHYWWRNLHAESNDIFFQEKFLPIIRIRAGNASKNNQGNHTTGKRFNCKSRTLGELH